MRLFLELDHALGELVALQREHLPVQQHACLFHLQQNGYERLFDVHIDLAQRLDLAEFRPQGLV